MLLLNSRVITFDELDTFVNASTGSTLFTAVSVNAPPEQAENQFSCCNKVYCIDVVIEI